MVPSAARLPMRTFAAGFFAAVALGTAAVLTVPLMLSLELHGPAVALPFFAAACAYGWAWLLHPRRDVEAYGTLRGAVVALLAYLSFGAILAVYLQWVMPARPGAPPPYRDALLLIVAFVWTPYPWFALIAGGAAGDANLRNVHARLVALAATARRVRVTCVAVLRAASVRLHQRAADPRAHAAVTMIVSSCLLFAGGALGLAWLRPDSAFSDAGVDTALRLLPGTVALMLAVAGWTCGRVLMAIAPAAYRLLITLMAAIVAGVAAVRFATAVVA